MGLISRKGVGESGGPPWTMRPRFRTALVLGGLSEVRHFPRADGIIRGPLHSNDYSIDLIFRLLFWLLACNHVAVD